MVTPDVCQGFTTDEVKAALRNINLTNAARPDKIHPRFLHHSDPVSIYLLTSILNKSLLETKVPQEWRVADIGPIPKGWKDLQKMESYTERMDGPTEDGELCTYIPHVDCLRYFAESMYLLTE